MLVLLCLGCCFKVVGACWLILWERCCGFAWFGGFPSCLLRGGLWAIAVCFDELVVYAALVCLISCVVY